MHPCRAAVRDMHAGTRCSHSGHSMGRGRGLPHLQAGEAGNITRTTSVGNLSRTQSLTGSQTGELQARYADGGLSGRGRAGPAASCMRPGSELCRQAVANHHASSLLLPPPANRARSAPWHASAGARCWALDARSGKSEGDLSRAGSLGASFTGMLHKMLGRPAAASTGGHPASRAGATAMHASPDGLRQHALMPCIAPAPGEGRTVQRVGDPGTGVPRARAALPVPATCIPEHQQRWCLGVVQRPG
jgi:hypothetical protein